MINKPLKLLAVSIMLCSANVSFAATIHNAVQTNDIGKVQRIIRENPSQLYSLDDNGQTPIHLAIENDSIPSLASLMGNGPVNLNIQNGDGDTPLVYAIKLNKSNSILFLLQKGSNPYYTDSSGQNALYYVKKFGNADTKMIFTEVMKYQEENSRKMKQQVAQQKRVQSTTKGGLKSVDDLIAENAVQRELLGQTQQQLNNSNSNNNGLDESNPVVKVNPVKENGFIYKNDLEEDVNSDSSESKKINDLSVQVSQLTDLLKQVLKPDQEKSKPIVQKENLQTQVIKDEQLSAKDKPSLVLAKPDPEIDSKIKTFIALNEKLGNDIPEKFKEKQENKENTQSLPVKDSSSGIYQTQERGVNINQERSVIPNNWNLDSQEIVSNEKKIDNQQQDKKLSDDFNSQEENVIPDNQQDSLNNSSNKDKEVVVQKDIPSMLLKQTISKGDENKELQKSEIVEKEIPKTTIDESKPLITEAQKKNIEEKIHDENERSIVMNATIASVLTVIILAFIGFISIFGYKVILNKRKIKEEKRLKDSNEHDQNRERIKNRLISNKPWNKKPD